MLSPLKAEGIAGLEFLTVTAPGFSWEYHAAGYDAVSFPVMPDGSGAVYYLYGATPYDVFLVDKKGRLVTRYSDFSDALIPTVTQRLRQLAAE